MNGYPSMKRTKTTLVQLLQQYREIEEEAN
jgi:hypothetical protein